MTPDKIKILTEKGVMARMRWQFAAMKKQGVTNLAKFRATDEAKRIHRNMFIETGRDQFWVEVDPGSIEAIRAQERGWALED